MSTAKRTAVKAPANHLRAVTSADASTNVSRLNGQIASLEQQIAVLKRELKIEEFKADPDAYERKIVSGANPDVVGKDNPFKKTAGSFRPLPTLMMEIFHDNPDVAFSSGTILSKLEDRGWVTRARHKSQMICSNLAKLCHDGKIDRISYGGYKLHKDC